MERGLRRDHTLALSELERTSARAENPADIFTPLIHVVNSFFAHRKDSGPVAHASVALGELLGGPGPGPHYSGHALLVSPRCLQEGVLGTCFTTSAPTGLDVTPSSHSP